MIRTFESEMKRDIIYTYIGIVSLLLLLLIFIIK